MTNCRSIVIPFSAVFAISCLCYAVTARAQDYSHIRIVRLSFVEGDVQYQPPGGEWQDAKLNLPIREGFALQTGDGYGEVEFEHGLAMRLASNSSVEFTELALVNGQRLTRLKLLEGTALISADRLRYEKLSMAASDLNLTLAHSGRFRVDVSPYENWVTVFRGKLSVESTTGPLMVSGGHALHGSAAAQSSLAIVHSPLRDAFDKWVSQRERALRDAQVETSDAFGSNYYITGFTDLDLDGLMRVR